MVNVQNLSAAYGIKNINLKIKAGEIVALLGPVDCGKTTLLRTIGGFVPATEGSIEITGRDATHLPIEKRATAVVFPEDNLWKHMTVFENMSFGLALRKKNRKQIKREVAAMLAIVNLSLMEEYYPHELTMEQQQRVAIARALVLQPALLLLDEPFSKLEENDRLRMYEELKRIQSEVNVRMLLATHDRAEALSLSHRVAVMENGRVVQTGTPLAIYDHPKNSYVASFIGEMNAFDDFAFRTEDILIFDDNQGSHVGIIDSIMLIGHYAFIRVLSGKYTLKVYVPKQRAQLLHEKQTITFHIEKKLYFEKEVDA